MIENAKKSEEHKSDENHEKVYAIKVIVREKLD
jgi:hypothetical protein